MERYEYGRPVAHGYACRCPECPDSPHPASCMCQRCQDTLRELLQLSLHGERKPLILPRAHHCPCGAECTGTGSPDGSRKAPAEPYKAAIADQAEQLRAAIMTPYWLDYDTLAARVPDQPPGTCQNCRAGPPLPGTALCAYCTALNQQDPAALGTFHDGHADHPCGTCPQPGRTAARTG